MPKCASLIDVKGRHTRFHPDAPSAAHFQREFTGPYGSTSATEDGRTVSLSPYTSNQSNQQATPWSYLAVDHRGEVLPKDKTDEDLSFPYEQFFEKANSARNGHSQATSKQATLIASGPPPDTGFQSMYHSHRSSGRPNAGTGRHAGSNLLSAPRQNSVSPAASSNSPASTHSRGGRQEGSHLSEDGRSDARGVRKQGSCYRCWRMREKVRITQPDAEFSRWR